MKQIIIKYIEKHIWIKEWVNRIKIGNTSIVK